MNKYTILLSTKTIGKVITNDDINICDTVKVSLCDENGNLIFEECAAEEILNVEDFA
jgi:hypothetical protein